MLTKLQLDSLKPQSKAVRIFDGRGLYVEINPNGGRYWRLKYRFAGKERRLALGVYPEVSLKEARDKCEDARRQVKAGIDPGEQRKVAKTLQQLSTENSFEAIAREWYGMQSPRWAPGHGSKIIRRLECDLFPWLGKRPIASITAMELLACLRRIEARGANETAHRAFQNSGRVFRYAVATGRIERDPSRDLAGALAPVVEQHHASITDPKRVGELLRAMEEYRGSFVTQCALRLAPLVFLRPGELRKIEWAEIDFELAQLRIPASRMKMRTPHIVPLSNQSIAVLLEIHPLTGHRTHVFPGAWSSTRPMSENAVNAALRRLGYPRTEMTGHGFRSMASTLLNEKGWNRDAIERQLAHGERDAVRAAYNYAEFLPERREMMQAWADYLDALRKTDNVDSGKKIGQRVRVSHKEDKNSIRSSKATKRPRPEAVHS